MAATDRIVGLVEEIRERVERDRPRDEDCETDLARHVAHARHREYEIGVKTGALVALAWAMRSWSEYIVRPESTIEEFVDTLSGAAAEFLESL